MKKIVLLAFVLMLLSTAVVVRVIRPAVAEGTIYIRADGSVEGTDKIQRVGAVYTFTDNIYDSIVVEKDNIVVDGAGYTLQGTGSPGSGGIYLSGRSNVTIRNMEIKAFSTGIKLYNSSSNGIYWNNITNNVGGIGLSESSNNTIYGNNITNKGDGIYLWYSSKNNISGNIIASNTYGILLYSPSSNYNTITENNITNNEYGIKLGSSNNTIYHNNFIDNKNQVYMDESVHNAFDDGYPSGGNYWSDYEERYPDAEEIDGSGIWDTPYVINENNQDNYPLMNQGAPKEEGGLLWMQWWFWTMVIAGIAVLTGAVYFLKKRKPPTPTAPPLPTADTTEYSSCLQLP